jgi:hypothetical protein
MTSTVDRHLFCAVAARLFTPVFLIGALRPKSTMAQKLQNLSGNKP